MPKKKTIEDYLNKFSVTKEYLYDAYMVRKLSLPQIRDERGIDFKACSKLLRHFGIPIRSISESRTTPESLNRYRNNLIKKHGVDNPSKLGYVKDKKRKTFLSHYGVDNIWKSQQYYKWLDSYMMTKYGKKRITPSPDVVSKNITKWWKSLSPSEREKKIQEQLKNLHRKSPSLQNTIELKLCSLLEILNIRYERRFPIGRYYADFYLKDFNLILECYGDYWHCNPKKYKATDIVVFPNDKKIEAQWVWSQDKLRLDNIQKRGYTCVVVWESDIKGTPEIIIKILKNETNSCRQNKS